MGSVIHLSRAYEAAVHYPSGVESLAGHEHVSDPVMSAQGSPSASPGYLSSDRLPAGQVPAEFGTAALASIVPARHRHPRQAGTGKILDTTAPATAPVYVDSPTAAANVLHPAVSWQYPRTGRCQDPRRR